MAAGAEGPAHQFAASPLVAARRTGAGGVFRRFTEALAAAWQRSEREAAIREAERRLHAAPDAILSDIGIRPDDVACAVRQGREPFGWR